MPTISLKVPESLDRDLSALAARRGVSKSSLMRDAISELMAREQFTQPSTAGSFAALAGDLAGCVDGPEDLSTHEDHLDGYGQ